MAVTPEGTALFAVKASNAQYHEGLKVDILDDVIEEIDIETGKSLFLWHTADHIDARESYKSYTRVEGKSYTKRVDPWHVNAVSKTPEGDIVVSSRNLQSVWCIDHNTGRIKWKLGGKASSFKFDPPSARFHWQHDARFHMLGGEPYLA